MKDNVTKIVTNYKLINSTSNFYCIVLFEIYNHFVSICSFT